MSNLLKEAIADARAMREMAVKQAKAALEEAFEPQIHSVITKKIQAEMEGDDEEEEMEVDEDIEVGADEDEHEDAKENSGLTEVEDTSDIGQGDNKEPSKASSEETTDDPGGEQEVQDGHEDAKENSGLTEDEEADGEDVEEDDLEFEAIIKELEDETEDEVEEPEVEIEDELGEADDDDEELDIEVEPEAEVAPEDEVAPEAEVEDEVEDEIEVEEEDEMTPEDDDDEELDLEALMGETEDEDEDDVEKVDALENKVSFLIKKLGEALKVVKYQKNRLNEVNILNAKLLFTNKVFRGFNLDNKAKVKVIENFDRAKTVREVKLIYATLMENLAVGEKKSAKTVKRLVEGASSVIKTTDSTKKIVNEDNEVKSRVHKLMGRADLI